MACSSPCRSRWCAATTIRRWLPGCGWRWCRSGYGIIAPFSGGLSESIAAAAGRRHGDLPAAAAIALTFVMRRSPDSMVPVMIALAAYGGGLGLFVAPNNSATLSAAPPERAGQAGGLLNLLRVFGTGLGVAAASTLLAWRIRFSTGVDGHTLGVPEHALLAAIADVMLMLATFAAIAGGATLLRARRRPDDQSPPVADDDRGIESIRRRV